MAAFSGDMARRPSPKCLTEDVLDLLGRGEGEAGDARSHRGIAGASSKGGVGRRVDEVVRYRGKDADGGAIAGTASRRV